MTQTAAARRPDHAAEALVLASVFASSFTSLLYWPGWTTQIQPAEIIFLVLLPVAVVAYGRDLWPGRDWSVALGAYVLANLAAGLAAGRWPPILESLGRGYLVVWCGIVAACVRRHGAVGLRRVTLALIAGGIALAAVSLIGYAWALAGFENDTVKVFTNYPYFGTVMRAAGFTVTPGMLAIVLGFPLLTLWTLETTNVWRTIGLALIALAMLLSLSKEVLLFAMGVGLLHPAAARAGARWKAAVVIVTAVALWAGSHAVLLVNQRVEDSYLAGTPYTSGRVLATIGNVQVVETSYMALKRANWALGLANPLLGVGPGSSNAYLAHMKAAGIYPAGLPEYDPHSTWMGAFSETGVVGFAALAALIAFLARVVWKHGLLSSPDAALRSAAMYLLILLIESVIVDAMNFRQIWLAVGVILGATGGRPRAQ